MRGRHMQRSRLRTTAARHTHTHCHAWHMPGPACSYACACVRHRWTGVELLLLGDIELLDAANLIRSAVMTALLRAVWGVSPVLASRHGGRPAVHVQRLVGFQPLQARGRRPHTTGEPAQQSGAGGHGVRHTRIATQCDRIITLRIR